MHKIYPSSISYPRTGYYPDELAIDLDNYFCSHQLFEYLATENVNLLL